MTEALNYESHRLDVESQRMLLELREVEKDESIEKTWLTTSELRDAAGVEQNSQVSYRMEKYLIPAGLVRELSREERPGGTDAVRRFRLTSDGSIHVIMHEDEFGGVATREEVRETAQTASETAESARDSVQSYRKKVSRLKKRVEQAEETAKETTEKARDAEKSADAAWGDIRENTAELEEISDDVAALTQRVDQIQEAVEQLVNQQSQSDEVDVFLSEMATTIGVLAIIVYLVVFVGVLFLAPDLLPSMVLGGLSGVLGIAVGFALSASA